VRDRSSRQATIRQHSRKTTADREPLSISSNLLRDLPAERSHTRTQLCDLLSTRRLSRRFAHFMQVRRRR